MINVNVFSILILSYPEQIFQSLTFKCDFIYIKLAVNKQIIIHLLHVIEVTLTPLSITDKINYRDKLLKKNNNS